MPVKTRRNRGKGAAFRNGPTAAQLRADAIADTARVHCRTLRDMSEREIRALEREYGCPVIRP